MTDTTPSIVTASGIAGLKFTDEATVINKYAAQLQAQGVQSIVVLMHEGANQSGTYNECVNLGQPIVDINANVTPAVDVIISGHSHVGYNCRLKDPAGNDRVVTQAANYGRLITNLDLVIDRRTGDVDRAATKANNIIVTRTVAKDPAQTALIQRYTGYLGPIATRELGTTSTDLRAR